MSSQDKPGNAAGKQAYEARRAAKAGVSLDSWLARKEEARKVLAAPTAQPNPVLAQARSVWRRLVERAHRPL
ncbi:hypothetical protein [Gluconacetobacter takamatsuzukensis]|uniref:Uncharacterized protein n=1 Tax=Gluconacetobacter takamatsuzukensis TaxID=1286190 RepID=A0A7W4PSN6_9PROT|nr:hypothetical protein [Gluconacetobacter takamatsuzukensis]MBB2206634.1 hypothetical protein [Gluconacetobacter takamatsuzukensis]